MKKLLVVLVAAFACCPVALGAKKESKPKAKPVVDPARVAELAAMLPERAEGVGRPIADRAAWKAVAAAPAYRGVVREAEKLAKQPAPDVPEELYLDFSKTGNRDRYQRAEGRRHGRLSALAVAECLENRGRFLKPLEETIRAICDEKSWTLPAHDRALKNFKGEEIDVDLWSSAMGWEMATLRYWLGDKLSPEVNARIESEVQRRVLRPYRSCIETGKPRMSWPACTNNWNAVCHAGVLGTALATLSSREDRAWYLAAVEKLIPNFLAGFTPDGYCSEGLGYWGYGFGHYVLLSETIAQATGGKLDWMASDHVHQIALFGRRIEILPGLCPAFADCSTHARPDRQIMAFASRIYGLGWLDWERQGLGLAAGSTFPPNLGVYGFENSAQRKPAAAESKAPSPIRDWFSDAGILICRPASGAKHALGAALKGGHNAEHHNHNDVGSFVVALGASLPVLDPGAEVYTARTFSSKRYESNVLNSFGHPVPRVAGQLQQPGRSAEAKLVRHEFTDQADTLVFDIASAYPVKSLKKLQRTFVFSRQGRGSLTVTDEVEFDSPQTFGTALITYSPWKELSPGRLRIGPSPDAVDVEITAVGGPFEIKSAEIHEDVHGKTLPVRIGMDLAKPVAKAQVRTVIRPGAASE